MTGRGWIALGLLLAVVLLCGLTLFHMCGTALPLLEQARTLEEMIERRDPAALPAAAALQRQAQAAARRYPFYLCHDEVGPVTEAADELLLSLRRGDADRALESLLLFRARLQHLLLHDRPRPETVF